MAQLDTTGRENFPFVSYPAKTQTVIIDWFQMWLGYHYLRGSMAFFQWRKFNFFDLTKVQLSRIKCWTPSTSQVLLQDVEGGSIAGQLGSDNAITCVVSGRGRWADGNQNVWSYLIKFKCCSGRPWRPCPSNKLKTMGPLHFSRLGGQGILQMTLWEY